MRFYSAVLKCVFTFFELLSIHSYPLKSLLWKFPNIPKVWYNELLCSNHSASILVNNLVAFSSPHAHIFPIEYFKANPNVESVRLEKLIIITCLYIKTNGGLEGKVVLVC